jgi:hypothetical protein
MFAQVIEGKATSSEALAAAGEAWEAQVRPVAEGFLGSTGGVAADGTAILVARFTDRAAAEANNDRPEQSAWFEAHGSTMFDGPPTFTESEDVDEFLRGGSNDAEFVQITQGRIVDRQALADFEARTIKLLVGARPDLIGGLRIWHDDNRFTEVNYFTSEGEARANEAQMGQTMADDFEEYMDLVKVDRWIDLTDPVLQ